MINIHEHVIVQRVVSLFSSYFNNLYPLSVTKIVDITHTIYKGLFKKRLCKDYVGRKVNNAPGANLRQNVAFARTPTFSPRVIT